jgi:prepilin-type N-terminal cleavage/methylation domain-containing protein
VIHIKANTRGYTLLETMIALTIFAAIVLPLTSYLYRDLIFARYQDKVTAQCLLDQEVRRAQVFPNQISPIKRRRAGNQDWEIRNQTTGDKLMKCTFTALKNNRIVGEVWVMIYNQK